MTLFLRYLELLFEIRPKNKAPYEARKIYAKWIQKSNWSTIYPVVVSEVAVEHFRLFFVMGCRFVFRQSRIIKEMDDYSPPMYVPRYRNPMPPRTIPGFPKRTPTLVIDKPASIEIDPAFCINVLFCMGDTGRADSDAKVF